MKNKLLIYTLVFLSFTMLSIILWFYFNRQPEALKHAFKAQFESRAEEQHFLNRWYAATNETYFDDQLPKDVKVIIEEISDDETIAQTEPLGNKKYIIEIDPRWNNDAGEQELSLDHEICHVYLMEQNGDGDREHGERFQNCMKRLAAENAFRGLW